MNNCTATGVPANESSNRLHTYRLCQPPKYWPPHEHGSCTKCQGLRWSIAQAHHMIVRAAAGAGTHQANPTLP